MTLTFLAPIEFAGRPRLPQPATNGLSDRDRAVVALAESRTYAAVASELGMTRSAVAGVMHRARQARPIAGLREKLEQRELARGLELRPSLYLDAPRAREGMGEDGPAVPKQEALL